MRGRSMQVRKPRTQKVKLGRPPSRGAPSKKALLRLYAGEGKSIREVAEALECSKDMVARGLRGHGIEARPNAKRSQLKDFPREKLVSKVSEKGIRGLARELGIHENTLRNYLKKT